ncbi:hypothetical protein TPHA_0D00870 [Tetrapisispora phaffii CBS 4417]|uniref:Protein DSS4 n=1 Tax=Tetrapisispora phaffii (strain ATCC 24235 / CBS 4417 / NBRC 1672 / NRRL Y-8282 / UCD 70-5) TaxID=1071381 RepID=G8BSA9_TETPH|nr:hypothetical protein TPHA_0D00870 [Tetrapisispora phaffii CBS 4417]CCE62730.1 hypothetical protein TPHA_0D00870 [Tetrapisispora phaffii CBS 4417]
MTKLRCSFTDCNSMIINLDDDKIVSMSDEIYAAFKLMQQKDGSHNNKFMIVNDIWDFDNVGVSRDIPEQVVDNNGELIEVEISDEQWSISKCLKYLLCADCDKGPIGMVCELTNKRDNSITKTINLLSLNSVSHI